MKESENNEFPEASSELPICEVLSAKEMQKIRHERRRDNIRKNSKTKSHVSLDLWSGTWGFEWAG